MTANPSIDSEDSDVRRLFCTFLFGVLASLFVDVSESYAETVLSNIAEPQSSQTSIGIPWIGQRFVTGPSFDWRLDSVSLSLGDTVDATSPLFVSIFSNLETNTPDDFVGNFTTGNFHPTTGGTYTYEGFDGGMLSPSTSYWLVLAASIDPADIEVDQTDYRWWDASSNSYLSADSWLIPSTQNVALGFFGFWVDVNDEPSPFLFSIDATPVPEIDPNGMGSVVALVTGALGLLERRRLKTHLAAR